MSDPPIQVDRDGPVGILRLNRPEKLNAWTDQMRIDLRAAMETFNADPAIRAMVLTGNGRAFCAGADISGWADQIAAGPPTAGERRSELSDGFADWAPFCRASKPLIAAVNGHAIGIGLTLILPWDIRIASEQAQFSARFVKMGLVPELGSTALLPRIVGPARALELCLTARTVRGEEAARIGLVHEVVPHEELLGRALAIAREIAANPPSAILQTKRLLADHLLERDPQTVFEREQEELDIGRTSPEHAEAVAAFMERREPKF